MTRPPTQPLSPAGVPTAMPWPLRNVPIPRSQQRVGIRSAAQTVSYALRGPSATGTPYGLVFFWRRPVPRSENPWVPPYLLLNAWHGSLASRQPFLDRRELPGLFAALGRRVDEPFPPQVQNDYEFLLARVEGMQPIHLQFALNTDDEHFLWDATDFLAEHPEPNRRPGFAMQVSVFAFDSDPRLDEATTIEVTCESVEFPGYDNGPVAIDLGHNTSTLARLPAAGGSSRDIDVLDAEGVVNPSWPGAGKLGTLNREASPVESNLRLTHIDEEITDQLGSATWDIGQVQRRNLNPDGSLNTFGLFLGVKRLVGARARRQRRVLLHNTLHPAPGTALVEQGISARLPAELFFCRLFQRFREAQLGNVRKFAVTYPTVFSRRELEEVREAAFCGWLRMMELKQTHESIASDPRCPEKVPLSLDEASAAGFFFLHRKMFEQPHGLARFRYLYPDGFNLLLYDCGGGTTDIGLLRAEVFEKDRKQHVRVRVRGRSGERNFGGNHITEAVFRILKARIALALQDPAVTGTTGSSPARVDWPQPQNLDRFLRERTNQFDAILPTRFRPGDLLDDEQQARRQRTLHLWFAAEEIKKAFSQPTDSPADDQGPSVEFSFTRGTPLHQYIQERFPNVRVDQVAGKLNKIRIYRKEIDALIAPALRSSLDRCNALIWHKLTRDDQEVHWVVVAGNGTRYPLFQEEIQSRLAVPFLSERLEVLGNDPDNNLKYAVAKGAVLALWRYLHGGDVEVTFDRDLPDRIPFDLAYHDEHFGRFIPLLREDERYDKLQNGSQELPIIPVADREQHIVLHRRWPGESSMAYRPYLTFRFASGLRGPVKVFYEPANCEFVVKDGTQPGQLIVEEKAEIDTWGPWSADLCLVE